LWFFTHNAKYPCVLLGNIDLHLNIAQQFININPYIAHPSIVSLTDVDPNTLPGIGQYQDTIIKVINNKENSSNPIFNIGNSFKEDLSKFSLKQISKIGNNELISAIKNIK
jgi:hypothetical protein